MNMTPSQLANSTLHFSSEPKPKPDPLAEFKAAHAAGKRVEYRNANSAGAWGVWHTYGMALPMEINSNGGYRQWRIAPWTLPTPPRMVPLTCCDVPPGSVFRYCTANDGGWWAPAMVSVDGVTLPLGAEPLQLVEASWETLRNTWLIRTPGEMVWRKCEKEAK